MNKTDQLYEQQQEILMLFVHTLKRLLGDHLRYLYLFGSRARGDYVPDSDFDCLVVLDRISPDAIELIDEIAGDFLYEYSLVFSVFPISEKRHAQQQNTPFLMNVQKESILL